jgi:hypothetical protein
MSKIPADTQPFAFRLRGKWSIFAGGPMTHFRVCAIAALAFSALYIQPVAAGTIYALGGGSIVAIDTSTQTIVNNWTTQSPTESALAIGSTVRTVNELSGANGAEYTLTGAFTGTTYQQSVAVLALDGTQDAAHNYLVDAFGGNVFSFDTNWANPVFLFNPASSPPAIWSGITYDAANNSLWLANPLTSTVADFTLAGALLSSFTTSASPVGLALDPADQTLWTSDNNLPGVFEQYDKSGKLLQVQTYPTVGVTPGGMEFAPATATPEPGVFGLAALGLVTLIAVKTRAWYRAGSR